MKRDKKGAALRYDGKNSVPRVLSVARGLLVNNLLRIAEKYDIMIYKDPDLAETLYELKAGSEIPEELWMAAAKVLAYCYEVNDEFKQKLSGSGN
jgi:flagellar biosynthesis protein